MGLRAEGFGPGKEWSRRRNWSLSSLMIAPHLFAHSPAPFGNLSPPPWRVARSPPIEREGGREGGRGGEREREREVGREGGREGERVSANNAVFLLCCWVASRDGFYL